MKKLSNRMKILLVMAVCASLTLPATALAWDSTRYLLKNQVYANGDYQYPEQQGKAFSTSAVKEKTTKLVFNVENGDQSGKNRVSSVKITLLDENGKVRAVAISPDQFNQKVSTASGTIEGKDLEGLDDIALDIRVRGPKNGTINLTVIEYYEGDWWDFLTSF